MKLLSVIVLTEFKHNKYSLIQKIVDEYKREKED